MKIKRSIFVLALLIFFIGCYMFMAQKYDPLMRYQYVTAQNRSIILSYMDESDIEYIVSQKIQPEQFMDFIRLPGFDAKNILYYDVCRQVQTTDYQYIVNFVNTYRSNFHYPTFSSLISNYSYNDLEAFYNDGYHYKSDNVSLIDNPDKFNTLIKGNFIIWKYRPKDLVSVDSWVMPSISNDFDGSTIQLQREVLNPLHNMTVALGEINGQTNGGLILTSGYISYDQQIHIYDDALIKYGIDRFLQYTDFPGQSEQQLGYTVTFTVASATEMNSSIQQIQWLNENAYKYGFTVRYPEGKEKQTGKIYQPLTLRYVGLDVAEELYTSKKSLNEIEIKE